MTNMDCTIQFEKVDFLYMYILFCFISVYINKDNRFDMVHGNVVVLIR